MHWHTTSMIQQVVSMPVISLPSPTLRRLRTSLSSSTHPQFKVAKFSLLPISCMHAEFVYPSSWFGDQTLLYRAARRMEQEVSLDPLPLSSTSAGASSSGSGSTRRGGGLEPSVAFGPAGGSGELNVSVVVSPVPAGFR